MCCNKNCGNSQNNCCCCCCCCCCKPKPQPQPQPKCFVCQVQCTQAQDHEYGCNGQNGCC